jgi:hypothetical protein
MLSTIFTVIALFKCYRADEVDLPPLIDSEDIAYFFESNDLDGLHWALDGVFARRSARFRDPSTVNFRHLPEQINAKGGGSSYTSAYKLEHDLEQALYLAKNLEDKKKASFFENVVAPIYREMLGRIPPLEQLERSNGLYPFKKEDYDLGIESIYNKVLHHTNFEELKDSDGNVIPLLNPNLDLDTIENTMISEGIVVIDNLLSPDALSRIRQLLLESTVWFQTKMPLKFGGYVGAYVDDGLHDKLLLQLAFELYHKLPEIMKGHFLKYM